VIKPADTASTVVGFVSKKSTGLRECISVERGDTDPFLEVICPKSLWVV